MKRVKKAAALLLVLVLAIGTTACGQKFDPAAYVTSCLDLLTKGETEEYTKYTGRTEEEAKADYESNIDGMMEEMEEFGLSEDLKVGYRQLYKDLYQKAKYKVTEAEKIDGEKGYKVKIETEQMTGVFNNIQDKMMESLEEYASNLEEDVTEDEMMEKVYQILLEELQGRLETITYNEAQTITVELSCENNVYSLTEDSYAAIDAALLDVTGL